MRTLGIQLTNICNFSCSHCYIDDIERHYLSSEFITKIATMLYNDFHSLYITGGEPLLHQDFLPIYKTVKNMGYIIEIMSNGYLFNHDIISELSKNKPHKIEITLYGMSENTYYRITGCGHAFSVVISNIKQLIQNNINLTLKYTALKSNVKDMENFISFCKKHNIPYSISFQIIPTLSGNSRTLNERLDSETIRDIANKLGLDLNIETHTCDAGRNLFIASDQRIQGCPVLRTQYDHIAEDDISIKTINNVLEKLRSTTSKSKFCPAWTSLENDKLVAEYINNISR